MFRVSASGPAHTETGAAIGADTKAVGTGEFRRETAILAPVGSEGRRPLLCEGELGCQRSERTTELSDGLFNRELVSRRSLQDEQKLMAAKGERLVLVYEGLGAFDGRKDQACGGTASFPGPQK